MSYEDSSSQSIWRVPPPVEKRKKEQVKYVKKESKKDLEGQSIQPVQEPESEPKPESESFVPPYNESRFHERRPYGGGRRGGRRGRGGYNNGNGRRYGRRQDRYGYRNQGDNFEDHGFEAPPIDQNLPQFDPKPAAESNSPKSPGRLNLAAAPFVMHTGSSPKTDMKRNDGSPSAAAAADSAKTLNTGARSFVPRTRLSGSAQPAMSAPVLAYGAPAAMSGMYPGMMILPGPQPMLGVPLQYANALRYPPQMPYAGYMPMAQAGEPMMSASPYYGQRKQEY